MLVRVKWLMCTGNLAAPDQKLLAGLDQGSRWSGLLDPGHMLKLGQERVVLLMARVDQERHLTAVKFGGNIAA